ncbi:DUF397 domain-containing protein [Streptomyces qaidamensis]|uniref:DUF397 domain-containing protein n=1 Tax=Streptomyces qaidamensis TaxID=1783515 RepID=UPI0036E9D917
MISGECLSDRLRTGSERRVVAAGVTGPRQAECLEVAPGQPDVPVRDSKAAHGPAPVFSRSGWAAFFTRRQTGHVRG